MGTDTASTSSELEALVALPVRHPRLVATALAMGGSILFAGATSVVSVLQLPAMVLAAPWALALSLVATSAFVAREGRKRLGTAGADADTERRILEVAVACGGRVTTTAVAYLLSMPLGEADRALTTLSRAGYLGVEAHASSGALVYVFPEIEAGLVPATAAAAAACGGLLAPAVAPLAPDPPRRDAVVGLVRVSHKSKVTAALLAICGGVFGVHKFYLGQPIAGLIHMALFWTFLPAIAGLFEGLGYLLMSDHAFDVKHNARLA
jgi:TM2 domain-containing membrane protein YozV